jgi:prophage antirepressor-like protein
VCYEGSEGDSDIRTLKRGEILYISLLDVQEALNKENRNLNESHVPKSIIGIMKGLVSDLDVDEYLLIENQKMTHLNQQEMFVTQPGLYRVLANDKSVAGKKFQRWLFHEVVPSITKHGIYPPPKIHNDSEVTRMAKTLLLEIEQREELERKTNEKFAEHEIMIRKIDEKVNTIKNDSENTKFIAVSDFCSQHGILEDQQFIQGWCLKLCAENNEATNKALISGEIVPIFPEHVVVNAIEKVKKKD